MRALACLALVVLCATVVPYRVAEPNTSLAWGNGRLYWCGLLFTGTLVDGHHETSFRRGLRDGQDVLQAETGHVLECRNWSNGSPEGLQVGWYRNGRPRYYRVYRRGLAQGTAYEWYDAPGSPLCRIGRFDRGQETGWQRMFRPDGTLRANYVVTVNATFGLMGTKECLK